MSSKHKRFEGLADKRAAGTLNAESNSTYDGTLKLDKDDMTTKLMDIDNARQVAAEKERLEEELAETTQKLAEAEQAIDEARQEIAAIEDNAIVPTNDASLKFRGLKMKAIGLDKDSIPAEMSENELLEIVHTLRQVNEAMQWTVGDLINHACSKWGEKYSHYAKATGYTEKTLREYAYIARSVDLSIRMDRLSFGHHQLVAGFKDKEGNPLTDTQQDWLSMAAAGDNPDDNRVWSVAQLRQAIIADKKANKASKRTPSDSRIHASQMRDLVKLLTKDVSNLSNEEREDYINHIGSLRRILNTVESKLKKSKQQVEA